MIEYLAHLDGQREASPPALVCAELLERSCCTMLQLIATEHRQPLWLPGSLVEQHLRGAPAAAPSERGGVEARARRSRAAAAKLKSALQAWLGLELGLGLGLRSANRTPNPTPNPNLAWRSHR